jgi:hypothetical protein
VEGSLWSAELPAEKWQRGPHEIDIRVRTTDEQTFAENRRVSVFPPAPELTTKLDQRQTVRAEKFLVRAKVRPGLPGQDVDVSLTLNGRRQKTFRVRGKPQSVEATVRLRTERNEIEFVATNRGATAGGNESRQLGFEVFYNPQRPVIRLTKLSYSPGNGLPDVELPLLPGAAVRVEVAKVRLRGTITAAETLTEATRDGTRLRGFRPGRDKTWEVDELVSLRPGPQTLTLLARTKNTRAEKGWQVRYEPPLPQIAYLPARRGLTVYDEGRGAPEMALDFGLTPVGAGEAFGIEARVNGRPLPARQVRHNRPARKVTVTFTPEVKESRVQVWLRSRWRVQPQQSDLVEVVYLRPPRQLAFQAPPQRTRRPVLDLTARVVSALPLLPGTARATVNGRKIATIEVKKDPVTAERWLVRLKGVSLDEAKNSRNDIRLAVSNGDGECLRPAECTVVFLGRPPKRPEVLILEPGNGNVTDAEVLVRFGVRSATPFTRVVLENGASGFVRRFDVTKLKRRADGFLLGEETVPLNAGLNHIRLVAANDGGETQAVGVVNSLPTPVRLLLDKLEAQGGGASVAARQGRFAGPAPRARLWLHGRVVWQKAKDRRLKALEWVRVRVNGVQQVNPVKLQAPGEKRPRERPFRVEVLLNRAAGNRLEVDLPGLPPEDGSPTVYRVDCARPEQEKRYLHVLAVGVGAGTRDQLRVRVLEALRAKPMGESRREFTLKHFERGHLYGPVVGNVSPDRVYVQLVAIRDQIKLLAKGGPSSHVVLVYYQGAETLSARGHLLRTSSPEVDPGLKHYRIPCDELEKKLADTLGAKILLLDVRRDAAAAKENDRVVNWPAGSYVAVMRYAQLGKAAFLDSAGLISAWKEAIGKADKLKGVDQQLQLLALKYNKLLQKRQGELLYDPFIPVGLEDLVIGP